VVRDRVAANATAQRVVSDGAATNATAQGVIGNRASADAAAQRVRKSKVLSHFMPPKELFLKPHSRGHPMNTAMSKVTKKATHVAQSHAIFTPVPPPFFKPSRLFD
jgi:hypothetical protein